MTTRERLHQLVDELSDQEVDEALRLIAERRGDAFERWLDSRPEEDEEISEQKQAAARLIVVQRVLPRGRAYDR